MAKPKAWRQGAAGEPAFPTDYEIGSRAVLQWTDIVSNHNKYYGVELHRAAPAAAKSGARFRVFTHYGRTDDLETNPNAGAKESRYFDDEPSAAGCYQSIYKEKTAKGYKEVHLASSKIGSDKARGQASGHVDGKTLEKIAGEKEKREKEKVNRPVSTLAPAVADLVRYIYSEATNALTTTVAAKITANGIETPLGVLTIGQIERGESILKELYDLFAAKKKRDGEIERLSGEFYSCIPHRVGRTRDAIRESVIDSLEDFEAKQETLQLMKDMLQVNGEGGDVLFADEADTKYDALRCKMTYLDRSGPAFHEIKSLVEGSQIKVKNIRVENVWSLARAGEHDAFTSNIGNQRHLFHGSRIKNWVGILSRGILMPKIVVAMGVNRTDAGWLGNGLYFGDRSCTSSFYTTPGKKKTRLMAVARVALGKQAEYTKITYGIEKPPDGFDSCWGVRNQAGKPSQFADDEFVVYRTEQQRLEYLVEFTA
jgi:predicted DNA-binding WGR domain protein